MEDFKFAGQHEDEKIVLILKQHGFYFIKPIFKTLGLVLMSLLIINIWGFSKVSSPLLMLLSVLIIQTISINWFKWANTIYLLSNERIILVEQLSWFNRTISEASLGNILYISHKVQGIFGTLFNFGTVHIRASGVSEEEIILQRIASPYEVQQQIIAAQKKSSPNFQEEKQEDKKEKPNKEEKANKDFWEKSPTKRILR